MGRATDSVEGKHPDRCEFWSNAAPHTGSYGREYWEERCALSQSIRHAQLSLRGSAWKSDFEPAAPQMPLILASFFATSCDSNHTKSETLSLR